MTPAVPDPTVEALRGVLNEHIWFGPANACKCGWQPIEEVAGWAHREHVAHALATFTARAAAPDALRVRIEAVIADRYAGDFTPILPKLRALLGD